MKIITFHLALALGLTLLLSSCSSFFLGDNKQRTYKMTFNEENSNEQNAIVSFISDTIGYFHVKAYNGIDISEGIYRGNGWSSMDKVILTIPAGETSSTLDVDFPISRRYFSYIARDITFMYSLEAGKQYMFKCRRNLNLLKGYDFFVGIYDVTENSILLYERQLIFDEK